MSSTDPSVPSAHTSSESPAEVGTVPPVVPESTPVTAVEDHKPPQRPGVVRRTTNTVKRFMLVLLGVILTLFAVSNSQDVKVRWVFGDPVSTPLILVIAITFVVGATIGWLFAKLGGRHGGHQQD